ncbi:hypothetical protein [Pseudoxanthomonas winnipegensis]|uniref:hypothetical protein n=1 Tax=Pseudoxanthomonas winnipegensis TaxID=2480810 RepID=UPI001F3AFD83|nr:hypothetical protein [Pseudoxanthomonas winnipegensis]
MGRRLCCALRDSVMMGWAFAGPGQSEAGAVVAIVTEVPDAATSFNQGTKAMTRLFGLLLLLVSGIARADTTQQGKIIRVVVESSYASVWLENQATNNECASDGRWVIDFSTDAVAKEKYSAILSAASSGTQVVLQYTTSEGCGGFGAKRIHYVDLHY